MDNKEALSQQTVKMLRFDTLRLFVVISLTVTPALFLLYYSIGVHKVVWSLALYFLGCAVIFLRIKGEVTCPQADFRAYLLMTILLILYGHYLGSEELDNKPWIVLIPIVALSLVGRREGLLWMAGTTVALMGIYLFANHSYNPFSISIQFAAMATTTYVYYLFITHNERNIVKISLLSQMDELTSTYNRRHFNKTYETEFRRLTRHHGQLSLMMIDIDHFKEYNDLYGHQQGDNVLMSVAATLRKSARRASDSVYRYGGEEFCILLPETDEESTDAFARQLCQNVRELKIPHQASPTGHLTISIGFSHCNDAVECTARELLCQADQALYAAKGGGRDQAVSAGAVAISCNI